MAEVFTSYNVDNDRLFAAALARARAVSDDLRIPLTQISADFYRSEKAIFKLGKYGQYPDLAQSTKAQRKRDKQPIYPILRRSGKLERSVTDRNDSHAIHEFINKATLVIGTDLEYGIFHQLGTKHMPMRKFLFIGPEAPRFANSDHAGRTGRWLDILNSFVLAKLEQSGVGNVSRSGAGL